MPTLASITELKVVAQRPDLPNDDEFALKILELASNKVADYCGRPDWETVGTGDSEPPRAARRIALFMAKRTFENPELEVAYGVGPLSGRSLDWAAYGLYLTPPEQEELNALIATSGDDSTGGLWTIGISGNPALNDDVYLDDVYGLQPIPYGDKSQAWAFTPRTD